jgi:DNA-binding CsgD family transcriptional regulator
MPVEPHRFAASWRVLVTGRTDDGSETVLDVGTVQQVLRPSDREPGSTSTQRAPAATEMQRAALSARQLAILSLLREGWPNKMIARELGMSESTVKVHLRNIMRKMGATNRTQAAYKAATLPDPSVLTGLVQEPLSRFVERSGDIIQDPGSHMSALAPGSWAGQRLEATPTTSDAANLPAPAHRPAAPVTAVLRVFDRWDIGKSAGAIILGSTEPDLPGNLRAGRTTLASRDMQDRARLLLDIFEGVYALLRDQDAERAWIRVVRDELGPQSVLGLMTEGSQRNLIRALAFVDHVNGR